MEYSLSDNTRALHPAGFAFSILYSSLSLFRYATIPLFNNYRTFLKVSQILIAPLVLYFDYIDSLVLKLSIRFLKLPVCSLPDGLSFCHFRLLCFVLCRLFLSMPCMARSKCFFDYYIYIELRFSARGHRWLEATGGH